MEFSVRVHEEPGGQYLEITGCAGPAASLRIPSVIEGICVRSIGPHAFEKKEEIRQVHLPDSVRGIGAFAFYGCRNLRKISLSDHAESWGTGAAYFCGSLSEIELRVVRGRYSILRDMLADMEQGLYVRVKAADSDQGLYAGAKVPDSDQVSSTSDSLSAMLYFPAYTHGFDEDTYARAFHTWIEGCGFAYRETVMRTEINFREYDLLFTRAMADGVGGVQTAANIALSRLMYPCSVRTAARKKYEEYLAAHGEEILLRLVGDHDRERAMFLIEGGYVSPEAAGRAVLTAAGQGDSEMVGTLMRLKGEAGNTDDDEFDLGEL